MNVVLCEYAEKREFTAGNKARTDTVKILIDCGYKHIPLYKSKSRKIVVFFQMIRGCLEAIIKAKKNDIVFIQYPYYPIVVNKVLFLVLRYGRILKKYKIALLIHDSLGLRTDSTSRENLKIEVKQLKKIDFVISHNDKMKTAICECGGGMKQIVLGPFDYLYNGSPVNASCTKKNTIVIAGNLSKNKCGYLYKISESIRNCSLNLYGLDYSGEKNERICYKGKFAPEELIAHLDGGFGLVWDGDSCTTCSGTFGRYLAYNNPHKFSLYIAAGLPLIVWSGSALAEYVKKYNLGIVVHSLGEVDSLLSKMSDCEYENIKNCVLDYREEIIHGKHLKKAIEQL